jgi:hypothetical protein
MTILLDGIVEIAGPVDMGAILITHAVQTVHIAVPTPFADFDTAVPRIPDIMHMPVSPFTAIVPQRHTG